MGRTRPSELPDATPFQSEIDEIIAERPPRLIRSLPLIILSMILISALIASIKKVEVIVTCSGRLVTDTPSIVLQPMEQAIIRELKAVVGDAVTKGQVLATMDPTFTQADLQSLSVQREALQAQVKGLAAELELVAAGAAETPGSEAALSETLYRQRIVQYRSRLRVFNEDILRLRANIRTTEDNRESLERQLTIARTVEAMRASLEQSQAGSKLQSLDAKSLRMRTERDYQNAVDHLIELHHTVETKLAERQSFRDEWRRQTLETLDGARAELTRVQESLVKTTLLSKLVVLTAPEDGVVIDVAKLSAGSVVRSAEPLVTIMPANATLVAEIAVSSKDVGYTKPGDEAVVKIDAFPHQRHGQLRGRLLWVSEESFQTGEPATQDGALPMSGRTINATHRGRMSLLSTKLKNLPKGIQLIPGMTLSADIQVGTHSVMSNFIYPFIRAFGESIREP